MYCRLITLLLPVACAAWTVEGPLIEPPVVRPRPSAAAEATPAAPAKQQAIEFSWDAYHSLVVIGDGVGQMRPAWVATYEQPILPDTTGSLLSPVFGMFGYSDEKPQEKLAVAYRAQAWLDAQGRLHIDAKQAVIAGPQADQWSPDSFIFTFPDRVETVDDNDSANRGSIDRVVLPEREPEAFRALQTKAQALVGDGI